ncbi:hypothetical protein, partial [Neobacillus niacini]|uniref:hypothetical protein n=1 Tax=Neobacillus niacini TaxID=86668 RepID=UPI002FFDC144
MEIGEYRKALQFTDLPISFILQSEKTTVQYCKYLEELTVLQAAKVCVDYRFLGYVFQWLRTVPAVYGLGPRFLSLWTFKSLDHPSMEKLLKVPQ